MKRTGFAAISGAACLALAACGGGADGGGSDDGVTTTTLTSEDGKNATVKTGREIKVDFPDGFALVPGGKVVDAMDYSDDEKTSKMVRFEAPQGLEELIEIYENQAIMAGFEIRYSGERMGIYSVDGPGPDGSDFAFQAMKGANGANTGSLTVNKK